MNYKHLYLKIINNIILKKRVRTPFEYYEKHHITPICLGGDNNKDNIILATPKEHYILHHLLCLIYRKSKNTEIKSKLASAFHIMCYHNSNKRKTNARMFETARKQFSKNHPMRRKEIRMKVAISHRKRSELIKKINYENLPLCKCGCGKKIKNVRNSYLLGHFPIENRVKASHTKSSNEKRSKSLKKYLQTLTKPEKINRYKNSFHSQKINHVLRGKKISKAKLGKKTRQKQIAIERFKKMDEKTFQEYIRNMSKIVQSRYINWRKLYV